MCTFPVVQHLRARKHPGCNTVSVHPRIVTTLATGALVLDYLALQCGANFIRTVHNADISSFSSIDRATVVTPNPPQPCYISPGVGYHAVGGGSHLM